MVTQEDYINRITAEIDLLLATTIDICPSLPREKLTSLFQFYFNCRGFNAFIESGSFDRDYEISVDISKVWLNSLKQDALTINFLECIPTISVINSLLQNLPRKPSSPLEPTSKDEHVQLLERRNRVLQTENQLLRIQHQKLEEECNRFKPKAFYPASVAVIQSLLDETRAIVKIEKDGNDFIAYIPPDISQEFLAPGVWVKILPTYHIEAILS